MSLVVEHRPAESRFVVAPAKRPARAARLSRRCRRLHLHTGVPPEFRGQGVAALLVEAGLAWARAQGFRVVPACSYVDLYIQRHRQWQDLIS